MVKANFQRLGYKTLKSSLDKKAHMYIVLYHFKVKPNQVEDFIHAWKTFTEKIYQHGGSLGSRLHKQSDLNYIAYAQWPSKAIFENSGRKLPKEADHYRDAMRTSCESITSINKMEVVEDLLKP